MRYIFFGTPNFAAIILEKLINTGFPPVALVCNPDRPQGRKKVVTPPPTKALLMESQIRVFQPEKLDGAFLDELRSLNADFYVVAAYAKILKRELLGIPRLGVIGVHPSLLPKYRGSSPIQTMLLNGDVETGVDLFMIDEKVDNGPVIASRNCAISEDDDYVSLETKLANIGANLLVETLPKFVRGEIKGVPQDDVLATYTRKFVTEDGFVEYGDLESAQDGNASLVKTIHNKVRALSYEPGAYTIKDGKRVKLLKSKIQNGALQITRLQHEGKTPIDNKTRL